MHRNRPQLCACIALALAMSSAPRARAATPAIAVHPTRHPPVIDGNLDDPVWHEFAPVSGFWKMRPVHDQAASESTQVWFAEDDQNLYVAFHAFDSHPDAIRGSLSPRDKCMDDDIIGLLLDTFHDHRRAYELFANSLGVQADGVTAEGQNDDFTPDFVWQSAGRHTSDGYVVELAIPFRSLRYPGAPSQTWGVVLVREVSRATEQDSWPPVNVDNNCILCQLADLTDVHPGHAQRVVEVLPSVTGLRRGASDPVLSRFAYDATQVDVGAGLKLGLTPSLIADATFKPDFSQVESDVAQVTVNQRFALFYPEKRPFFLEGQELFTAPLQLVNTRTIFDPIAAGKLTGQAGSTMVGAIAALDRDPLLPVGDVAPNGLPDRDAGFGVLRLKQPLGPETTLGFLGTDRELGSSHNRLGGFDGIGHFAQHWSWNLQGIASDTRNLDGSGGAGSAVTADLAMQRDHPDFEVNYTDLSPRFRADAGYVPRVDIRDGWVSAGWQQRPGGWIGRWRLGLLYEQLYDHAGFLEEQQVRPNVRLEFAHQITWTASVKPWRERFAGVDFDGTRYISEVNAEPWKRVAWSIAWSEGDEVHFDPADAFGAWGREVDVTATLHATDNLALDLSGTRALEWRTRGGAREFDVELAYARLNYQFNRALALRAVAQWQSIDQLGATDRQLDMDVLASYTPYPGTVCYVGYDDGYGDPAADPAAVFHRDSRAMFFKVSYLWRR
ncbi:MAG TPA: DUF5916 domain-containing protein [Candidatus Eisenbacteria bacterium]|nr:DUF5916 domain-containing protein [Candidatus Eisenbacteria bacterium]